MKYKAIFEEAWKELLSMAEKREYIPNQEQDIVCMMYHLCLIRLRDTILLHASSAWNYDLIIGRPKGEKKREMRFKHCLIAEFKFILRRGRKNKRLNGALDDIKRLSRVKDPSVRRIFVIFDKVDCLTETDLTDIKEFAKKKKVFVLHNRSDLNI